MNLLAKCWQFAYTHTGKNVIRHACENQHQKLLVNKFKLAMVEMWFLSRGRFFFYFLGVLKRKEKPGITTTKQLKRKINESKMTISDVRKRFEFQFPQAVRENDNKQLQMGIRIPFVCIYLAILLIMKMWYWRRRHADWGRDSNALIYIHIHINL